jgi:ferredoxin
MIKDHPSILAHRERVSEPALGTLYPSELRKLLLEAGADDVAFVSLDRADLDGERPYVLQALPGTRALISFCVRLGREPIRSPARSIANNEFHHGRDQVDDISRDLVRALQDRGIRALAPSQGFPMEMDHWPGRIWVVQHKTVAVAAGLGVMGIHRNVIHPKFGNFILLGTIFLAQEVEEEGKPLDLNPCFECKLCVSACPVGAIGSDGNFQFSACYTHNYREFMGGFTDWVESIADAKNAEAYRAKVEDSESVSMWQSLAWGASYKAAYCMSVCPAGDDVIGPFLEDRSEFLNRVVKPLQQKEEPIYVMPGTDAEAHCSKRFPQKTLRKVGKVLRPTSVRGFVDGLALVFQRGKARGLSAVYHFRFSGSEERDATVSIDGGRLEVQDGLIGSPDLVVRADASTWVQFLRGERSIVWALLTRKVRLKGSPKLLLAFGKCFA